ncbi:MFS transporter [Rhodococcus jostii]|uniref:MFS transporter n=1 Tax=Rhodococcus jostii TaxID=132919 RepID=UPI0036336395
MRAAPHFGGPIRSRSSAVVGFLIIMEFGSGLLQGWYPPLLTNIGDFHDTSAAALNWVSAIFLLTSVACVPIIAKLGDVYGHRKMLILAASSVALGSFVIAFAPSYPVLLLGRALQAPLIAFLPLEFAIIRHRSPETSGRCIAYLIGALTGGAVVGGLLAGGLMSWIDNLMLVLLVPGIVMAICVPVARLLVRESAVRMQGRIDWAGAALLSIGLLTFLGGIANGNAVGWTDPLIVGLVSVGVLVLGIWVAIERVVRDPLVNFRVMAEGRLVLPTLIAALLGGQLFGSQAPSALFLRADPSTYGYGLGATAAMAGLALSLNTFGAFIGSTVSDYIASRITPRLAVVLGASVTAVAYALMVVAPSNLVLFSAWLFVLGIGVGVLIGTVPSIVVDRAPADSIGIASGIYNSSRTAAGSIAGAFFALIMSSMLTPVTIDNADKAVTSFHAYQTIWGVCGLLCVLTATFALFLDRRTRQTDNSRPSVETALVK